LQRIKECIIWIPFAEVVVLQIFIGGRSKKVLLVVDLKKKF